MPEWSNWIVNERVGRYYRQFAWPPFAVELKFIPLEKRQVDQWREVGVKCLCYYSRLLGRKRRDGKCSQRTANCRVLFKTGKQKLVGKIEESLVFQAGIIKIK